MQNLSSYLKHGFAWSYLFCSIVRFCARLTRVKLMSCWIQKLRCCMYVVRCWTRVYLYMSWFISCPAGLYLVQLVYILIWAEMQIDRLKNELLFNGPHVQWVLLFLMSTNLLGPYANGPKLTHLLEVTSSSTSASMWQPRHNHFSRHCHVIWYANVHIMLHIIYVWCGHWICDDVCGVYFRHKK